MTEEPAPEPPLLRELLSRPGISFTVALSTVAAARRGATGCEQEEPASQLGRYPVLGRLGAGGMGEVMAVLDQALGREVALKRLRATSASDPLQERFVREARITGQLQHPNIIPVHELGSSAGGQLYFTMKRVEGEDLSVILEQVRDGKRGGGLAELLGIFLKLCDAVRFAHSRGVIHRDLKPQNILVGRFGEVLVCDWGLAKILGEEADPAAGALTPAIPREGVGRELRTADGAVIGTPAYMPPEQAAGRTADLDERSDVYSLGAVLYQILTLDPPFTGEDHWQVLAQVLQGQLVPPSERSPGRQIPWDLEQVVLRAMALDPRRRHASASALREDIEAFLEGLPTRSGAYSRWRLLRLWSRRHWRALVWAALLLVALVAGGIAATVQWRRAERSAARATRSAEQARAREHDAVRAQRRAQEALARLAQSQRAARHELHCALAARSLERSDAHEAVLHAARALTLRDTPRARALWYEAVRRLGPRFHRRDDAWLHETTFSRDGRLAATISGSRVRLWEVASGRDHGQLEGHRGEITAVCFAPDARRLATGSGDRSVRVWEVATRKEILRHADLPGEIVRPRYSPDGRLLLAVLRSKIGGTDRWRTQVWDGVTGRLAHQIDGLGVSFDPGSRRLLMLALAKPGPGWLPRVLDLATGRVLLLAMPGDGGLSPMNEVEWSHEGDRILSSPVPLRLWDAHSGRQIPTEGAGEAMFVRDGHSIALANLSSGVVELLHLKSGKRHLLQAPWRSSGAGLVAHPVGPWLATSTHRRVLLWNLDDARLVAVLRGESPRWVGRGSWLATRVAGELHMQLWQMTTGALLHELRGGKMRLYGAAMDSQGRWIATVGHEALELSDAPSGQRLWRRHGDHFSYPASVAFGPHGRRILTTDDNQFALWDARTGKLLRRWRSPQGDLKLALLAPDGRKILAVSEERKTGVLRVLDAASGRMLRALRHPYPIEHAAWDPGGRRIALLANWAAGGKQVEGVLIWEVGTDRVVARHPVERSFNSLSYAPDGRLLIGIYDGAVVLAPDGKQRIAIRRSGLRTARFSLDGRRILALTDSAASVLDADTGQPLARFTHPGSKLQGAVFGARGGRLLTTSEDGRVRVWNLDPLRMNPEEALRHARRVTGRSEPEAEGQQPSRWR